MVQKESELCLDISHDRIGWNLRTFEVVSSCPGDVGDFINVISNVPLSIPEAVFLYPHLRDWIVRGNKRIS